MVRSGKSEEPTSACLGEEVEDIMVEDEYGELTLSPEPFSTSEKPVFEDSAEFEHCLDNDPGESKWEKAPSLGAVSTGGGQWESNGNGKATKSSDDNDWSGWGRKAEPDVTVTNAQENTSNSAWDTTSSWGNKATITSNDNDWSNCSTKEVERDSFTSMEKTPKSGGWDTASTWGTKTKDDSFNGETAPEKSNQWSSLQKDKAETQDAFHKKAEMASKSSGWEDKAWSRGTSKTEDNWSGQVKDKAESFQVPVQKVSSKTNGWGSTGGWTKNSGGDHQAEAGWNDGQASMDREEASDRWDRKATQKLESHQTSSWGSPTVCDSKDSFPSKAVDHGDSVVNHSWDRQKSPEASQGFGNDAWQQQKSQDVIKPSHANNESNRSGWGSQIESNEGSDHGFDQVTSEQKSSDTRGWDSQEKMDKPWDKQKSLEASQSWGSQNDSLGSWGQPQRASEEFSRGSQDDSSTQFSQLKPPETSLGWEQQKSPEVSHGWGSHKESSEQTSSHGWDKKNQGSKGWGGNAGEWKNRKNRPPKSPGMSSDDANLRALYTASGQRLDMFTTEEQDILADIEPIMQSIRKVMHQSGYIFPLDAFT